MGFFGTARNALFRLPLHQAEGATRGFRPGAPDTRARLDRVAKCVVHAYNLGLQHDEPEPLSFLLELNDPELRGFAYEGGAMGLFTADLWGLRKDRFQRFVAGPASPHRYMSTVGAGLVLGIFRRNPLKHLEAFDPFTRWLALNGYGFHNGFFRTEAHVRRCEAPTFLTGVALRAYDEGLGRALWFIEAGEAQAIAATIQQFPEARRPSIWAGVGLACVYAHGIDEAGARQIRQAAGTHYPHLFQGALMAAHTRHVAGNAHTSMDAICSALTDTDALSAHRLAQDLLVDLSDRGTVGDETSWEVWLGRLRERAPMDAPASARWGTA